MTSIHFDLLMVACVVDYIVGVSGFTLSWRTALARILHTTEPNLKELKPFDCPACMSWWCCLAWCIIQNQFTLLNVTVCAFLSLLSFPLCQTFVFIREALLCGINKVLNKLEW